MPKRSSKLPTDPSQRARAIVDLATDEREAQPTPPPGALYRPPPAAAAEPEKNPAAVALGKLGGAKGGPARAKALSKKRRAEIAKAAAKARWRRK
jgi:hypothetical protein